MICILILYFLFIFIWLYYIIGNCTDDLSKNKPATQSTTALGPTDDDRISWIVMPSYLSLYMYIYRWLYIYTDDLSKDKVATQSTTYPHGGNDPNTYVARNAVDRDITTCMRANQIGIHSPYKTVWWKVDLGRVHSIYSVNILFKSYDRYGML